MKIKNLKKKNLKKLKGKRRIRKNKPSEEKEDEKPETKISKEDKKPISKESEEEERELKKEEFPKEKLKETEIEKPISPKEEVQIAFEIPKSKVIQEYEICPNNEFRFEVIERRPLKQKEKTSKLDKKILNQKKLNKRVRFQK